MSITEQGIDAEKKARLFLKKKGMHNIQQIDWLLKYKKKYFIIEVKNRELYEPPPFLGTGLDIRQLNLRREIFLNLKIDTILLVFSGDFIYWQSLFTVLEKTKYFDTKNKIRIYDILKFKKELK